MNFNSKKTFLITSAITAVIFSRLMFVFFDDPEGPNLLVVFVMALFIYAISFIVHKFFFSNKLNSYNQFLILILVQFITIIILYFCLS